MMRGCCATSACGGLAAERAWRRRRPGRGSTAGPARRAPATAACAPSIQSRVSVPILTTSAPDMAGELARLLGCRRHDRRGADGDQHVGREGHGDEVGDVVDQRRLAADAVDAVRRRSRSWLRLLEQVDGVGGDGRRAGDQAAVGEERGEAPVAAVVERRRACAKRGRVSPQARWFSSSSSTGSVALNTSQASSGWLIVQAVALSTASQEPAQLRALQAVALARKISSS